MNETISYAQLHAALVQLGFRKVVLPSANIQYRHEASGTSLVFPAHRPEDRVPAASIIGTRKVVVDRGVAKAELWNELLQAPAA